MYKLVAVSDFAHHGHLATQMKEGLQAFFKPDPPPALRTQLRRLATEG